MLLRYRFLEGSEDAVHAEMALRAEADIAATAIAAATPDPLEAAVWRATARMGHDTALDILTIGSVVSQQLEVARQTLGGDTPIVHLKIRSVKHEDFVPTNRVSVVEVAQNAELAVNASGALVLAMDGVKTAVFERFTEGGLGEMPPKESAWRPVENIVVTYPGIKHLPLLNHSQWLHRLSLLDSIHNGYPVEYMYKDLPDSVDVPKTYRGPGEQRSPEIDGKFDRIYLFDGDIESIPGLPVDTCTEQIEFGFDDALEALSASE